MPSENENWVLGITLGLLGSIAINTGNNIQFLGLRKLKQAQEKVQPEPAASAVARKSTSSLPSLPWLTPPGKIRLSAKTVPEESEFVVVKVMNISPFKSVIYVIGTVIFVSGSILNFVSYAYAAQSMLASLESVQFVTNLLFGKFLLGAHITRVMLVGTFLATVGTIVAVQFSSKTTVALATSEMIQLYCNPAYLTYLVLMCVTLVVLDVLYKKLNERKRVNGPFKHCDVVLPIIYSVWSSLVGTQSVVHAKVLAELLAVHGDEENIFQSWFTWVTIVAWLWTTVVWLKRLNDALKVFNPLFIIPLLQCGFIFFAIISGGIFFHEFDSFDLTQWLGFWFGIIVMFSGLVLLTPKPKADEGGLANQLLKSNDALIGTVNCKQREQNYDAGVMGASPNEKGPGGRRYLRLSKEEFTSAALDAVMEVLKGDPMTRKLSEEMLITVDVDARRRRRNKLEKLLGLIKENPISSDGYSEEITNLIRELQLSSDVPSCDATTTPGRDIRDEARRLNITHERLRGRILLEIERSSTPSEAPKAV